MSEFPSPNHLPAERLAALADEAPAPAEAAHLAACAACRAEQAAYVALVDLARGEGAAAYGPSAAAGVPHARGDDAPGVRRPGSADAEWAAVAAALRAEGLTRDRADEAAARSARPVRPSRPARTAAARAWRPALWPTLGRLAAGFALVAGAAGVGRVSAARGPWALATTAAAAAPAPAPPATPDAARTALARARQDYVQAAAVLAELEPAGDPAVDDGAPAPDRPTPRRDTPDAELLRTRLAALDGLMPRVRAAAHAAPQDPAVNHVYLTAYDAREAALRQLGRTLPAGERLTGY